MKEGVVMSGGIYGLTELRSELMDLMWKYDDLLVDEKDDDTELGKAFATCLWVIDENLRFLVRKKE